MQQELIEVDGLSKVFDGRVAVRALSFTVRAGEVVGLVGPNGAGKTTTLRTLAGILAPTAGRVQVAGHDLAAAPLEAKRRLAFVPDEPHLFDYLTSAEHLELSGRLYGVPDAAARAARLLAEFGLADRRDALPAELSRGMRQKLVIAAALVHEPDALLLDEPLTGLDPVAIRRMKETIRGWADAGHAVLLSSHLLHVVEELCDRVVVLRAGERIAMGTIAEIVAGRPGLAGRSLEDVFLALVDDPAPGAA